MDLGNLTTYNGAGHEAHSLLQEPANYSTIESGLIFVGIAALMDPPRPEAPPPPPPPSSCT